MLASVQYTGDKSWLSIYLYAALYLFCSLCGASLMIISAVRFSPYIINRGLVDNKTESEGFMQNTKLMINKHSINLPMEFYFNGNKKKGWINILNPFRATVVLGVVGSGKTYSTQEEYHRHEGAFYNQSIRVFITVLYHLQDRMEQFYNMQTDKAQLDLFQELGGEYQLGMPISSFGVPPLIIQV